MSTTPRPESRLSVTPIHLDFDPDDILAAVENFPHGHLPHTVRLDITDELSANPCVRITEGERVMGIDLNTLTQHLNRHADADTEQAIIAGILDWANTRPVCDHDAAHHGIATLGWRAGEESVRWRVVVARDHQRCHEWIPTTSTSREFTHAARDAAIQRARQLTVTPIRTGRVTVWTHLANPTLSSAVLADLSTLRAHTKDDHPYAVFAPGRPVVVAHADDAHRLAEETTDAHLLMPLSALTAIGWS